MDPTDEAAALFRRQQGRGLFPGGQLVVRKGGETLLEVCVGVARGFCADEGTTPERVAPDTPFQVMSASKAVVAVAIALLEERGRLDVGAPVARWFPGFAAHGKEAITVADVLMHRSGLVLSDLVRQPALWSDWPALVAAIAEARPEYPRGTLAYESHAFGWILGEVVRRVTGRSLPEFLAENLPRSLEGLRFLADRGTPLPARTYWLGARRYRLGEVDLADGFEQVNNEVTCHQALVPGAGMLTTARVLATFYELLLGGQLVGAGVLRSYITAQTAGRDRITGAYVVLGRGFAMGWRWPHLYGWWGSSACFGHAGGFGCLAFADPRRQLAIAILTNGNRSLTDMLRRFAPLSHRLRRIE